jgi:hypothetical protein
MSCGGGVVAWAVMVTIDRRQSTLDDTELVPMTWTPALLQYSANCNATVLLNGILELGIAPIGSNLGIALAG